MIAVPPDVYGANFALIPSEQRPNLPWQIYHKALCCKAKSDSEFEVLVHLISDGVFGVLVVLDSNGVLLGLVVMGSDLFPLI